MITSHPQASRVAPLSGVTRIAWGCEVAIVGIFLVAGQSCSRRGRPNGERDADCAAEAGRPQGDQLAAAPAWEQENQEIGRCDGIFIRNYTILLSIFRLHDHGPFGEDLHRPFNDRFLVVLVELHDAGETQRPVRSCLEDDGVVTLNPSVCDLTGKSRASIQEPIMDCPFPGMDPYLERREIWPDFHDTFISYVREALQPVLRPRYAALTQNRLYVVEHERPIYPDVSVIETSNRGTDDGRSTSVLPELDEPLILELETEEIHQSVLHIIEPAAGNRIISVIEVLSPDNKLPGPGRNSYCRKYAELWESQTHLIEIDLLCDGQRVPRVAAARIPVDPPWNFVVSVSRWPNRLETYRFGLRQRLPRIAIPLAHGDNDVRLDLQSVFTRCWQSGPYPELLGYDGPPPQRLVESDLDWCQITTKKAAASLEADRNEKQ